MGLPMAAILCVWNVYTIFHLKSINWLFMPGTRYEQMIGGNDFINMFSHFVNGRGSKETESKALPGLGTCSLVEPFGFVHHKPGQKLHISEFL